MRFRTTIQAVLTLALILTLPTIAGAQTPDPGPPAEAPDQAELETFTEVYVDVSAVQTQMQADMAEAETQEEAQAIQQRGADQIRMTLETHEFSEERYTGIIQLLNQDQELRAQFDEIYQEMLDSD